MGTKPKRLYKTIPFHHAVQLLTTGKLYLARPDTWADPYENRLKHVDFKRIYAQCWCGNAVSDAMWRIYSSDHLGVRISTTVDKLREALIRDKDVKQIKGWGAWVKYKTNLELDEITTDLKRQWKQDKKDIVDCSKILKYKRTAYSHEKEFRIVIIDKSEQFKAENAGFTIDVNPHDLIDSILVDPRAPKELADSLVFYFKRKLKFAKTCHQSVLYRAPADVCVDE